MLATIIQSIVVSAFLVSTASAFPIRLDIELSSRVADRRDTIVLAQCQTVGLTWADGTAPYTIVISDATDILNTLKSNVNSVAWPVAAQPGAQVSFVATDASGNANGNGPFAVVASNDTSCLADAPAPEPLSSSSSVAPASAPASASAPSSSSIDATSAVSSAVAAVTSSAAASASSAKGLLGSVVGGLVRRQVSAAAPIPTELVVAPTGTQLSSSPSASASPTGSVVSLNYQYATSASVASPSTTSLASAGVPTNVVPGRAVGLAIIFIVNAATLIALS